MGAGAGAATRAVMGRGLASVGGKLLGFGGKLLGFLGGPWGLAIMAIATFLPLIINKISSRKGSQDTNTNALHENTAAVNTLAGQYATEEARRAANKSATTEQELKMVVNLLGQLVRGQKDQNININLRNANTGAPLAVDSYDVDGEMFDTGLN